MTSRSSFPSSSSHAAVGFAEEEVANREHVPLARGQSHRVPRTRKSSREAGTRPSKAPARPREPSSSRRARRATPAAAAAAAGQSSRGSRRPRPKTDVASKAAFSAWFSASAFSASSRSSPPPQTEPPARTEPPGETARRNASTAATAPRRRRRARNDGNLASSARRRRHAIARIAAPRTTSVGCAASARVARSRAVASIRRVRRAGERGGGRPSLRLSSTRDQSSPRGSSERVASRRRRRGAARAKHAAYSVTRRFGGDERGGERRHAGRRAALLEQGLQTAEGAPTVRVPTNLGARAPARGRRGGAPRRVPARRRSENEARGEAPRRRYRAGAPERGRVGTSGRRRLSFSRRASGSVREAELSHGECEGDEGAHERLSRAVVAGSLGGRGARRLRQSPATRAAPPSDAPPSPAAAPASIRNLPSRVRARRPTPLAAPTLSTRARANAGDATRSRIEGSRGSRIGTPEGSTDRPTGSRSGRTETRRDERRAANRRLRAPSRRRRSSRRVAARSRRGRRSARGVPEATRTPARTTARSEPDGAARTCSAADGLIRRRGGVCGGGGCDAGGDGERAVRGGDASRGGLGDALVFFDRVRRRRARRRSRDERGWIGRRPTRPGAVATAAWRRATHAARRARLGWEGASRGERGGDAVGARPARAEGRGREQPRDDAQRRALRVGRAGDRRREVRGRRANHVLQQRVYHGVHPSASARGALAVRQEARDRVEESTSARARTAVLPPALASSPGSERHRSPYAAVGLRAEQVAERQAQRLLALRQRRVTSARAGCRDLGRTLLERPPGRQRQPGRVSSTHRIFCDIETYTTGSHDLKVFGYPSDDRLENSRSHARSPPMQ